MKKNIFKFIICICALSIFAFVSCKSENKLIGNWSTKEFIYNNNSQNVIESNLVIFKENGKYFIGGNSGLNSYNAPIKFIDNKITVSENFALTKMAGSPEQMDYEEIFIKTLATCDTFILENNTLTIFNSKENAKIIFIKK